MKKSASVLAVIVAATCAGLSACGNPTDEAEEQQAGAADIVGSVEKDTSIANSLPDDIKSNGKITISINPDVEPIKYIDGDGDVAGLNPDLLRAAAAVLGVEAEFEEGTFDSMVPGLEAKRFDLIASVGDFVERQTKIDFIDYLQAGTGLLGTSNMERNVSSPEDLCGLKVGYVRGTAQQGFVETADAACLAAGEEGVTDSAYNTSGAGILALKSGADDAFWGDLPQLVYNVKQDPDLFKLLTQEKSAIYGIGVNKEDSQLRDALREALLKLESDGVYDQLLEQWGQEEYGMPDFPINADLSLEG